MSTTSRDTAKGVAVPTMLDTQTAADILGVSERTLRLWREVGTGPVYSRLGHRTLRYELADLIAFIDARREDT